MHPSALGAEKRRHIVETAYRLFRRDGFHATGIDRIIAEAEVAKMTVYRHFPSKDGLIVEVLNWRAERFRRQLGGLVDQAATPQDKITAILDWHERWFASADFNGCLFQHALAEFGTSGHPVFDAASRQKRDLQRFFRDALAPLLPAGRIATAATALAMLIEGATLLAQTGQGRMAIDSARTVAAEILAT